MSCPSREILEALAAGRATEPGARAHLQECADCRAEVKKIESVRTVLASWSPYEPDELELARIDRKVLARLAAPPEQNPLVASLWMWLGAATALVAAIVAVWPAERLEPVQQPQAVAVAVGAGPSAWAASARYGVRLLESVPALGAGDTVGSGEAMLTVQTGQASGFQLGRDALARLETLEPQSTALRIERGAVLSEVSKLAAAEKYLVRAQDLTVAVRGTAFQVSREPGRVRVELARGQVLLTRDTTGEARWLVAPAAVEIPDGAALEGLPIGRELDPALLARLPLGFADEGTEIVLAHARASRITSSPAGARVLQNGGYRGETPLTLLIGDEAGQMLRLQAAGRKDLDIEVIQGSTPFYSLEPIAVTAPATPAALPAPPRRPASPHIALEDPQVKVRREAMLFQVRTHLKELVQCYERAMKRNPQLSGSVTLSVVLEPSGAIKDVSARESQTDASFLDCAATSVRSWALPGTGEEESFELPLRLSPKE